MSEVFICAACQAEQLGRVNRCWKCGRDLPIYASDLSRDPGDGVESPPQATDESAADIILAEVVIAELKDHETSSTNSEVNPGSIRETDSVVYISASSAVEPFPLPATAAPPPVISNSESPVPQIPDSTLPSAIQARTNANSAELAHKVQYDKFAARGGAVASVGAGVMSIIGSFFTPFSLINALIGLFLGAWGLTSNRRGLAMIGISLCLLGGLATFSLPLFNVLIQRFQVPTINNTQYEPDSGSF